MANKRTKQISKIIKKTIKNGDTLTKAYKETKDVTLIKHATRSYSVSVRAMVAEIKMNE